MPRKTHATHPDHVRSTPSRAAQPDPKVEREAHLSAPHSVGDEDPINGLWFDLRDLLLRDDGWLRIVPDGDQKTVWYKWKFTRGKWSNHYVMVRGEQYQHGLALSLLSKKLAGVDLGYDRPSQDRYYDQT